jgi:hypothetical protein
MRDSFTQSHTEQTQRYTEKTREGGFGLLLNFNVKLLKDGIRRFIM